MQLGVPHHLNVEGQIEANEIAAISGIYFPVIVPWRAVKSESLVSLVTAVTSGFPANSQLNFAFSDFFISSRNFFF